MTRGRGGLWLLLAACLGIGTAGERSISDANETAPSPARETVAEPELSREPAAAPEETPLLLLDDPAPSPVSAVPLADNSRCHVCHLNYAFEDLAAKHAAADVGCVKCHGDCDDHIADESWASGGNGTAPDIMYPRAAIAPGCFTCHKLEKVFLETEKHKPDVWLIAYGLKVCTDCHGNHRLTTRKCRWK